MGVHSEFTIKSSKKVVYYRKSWCGAEVGTDFAIAIQKKIAESGIEWIRRWFSIVNTPCACPPYDKDCDCDPENEDITKMCNDCIERTVTIYECTCSPKCTYKRCTDDCECQSSHSGMGRDCVCNEFSGSDHDVNTIFNFRNVHCSSGGTPDYDFEFDVDTGTFSMNGCIYSSVDDFIGGAAPDQYI